MKASRSAFGVAAGVLLLAGCSTSGTTPPAGSSLNARIALTSQRHQGIPIRRPLAHSWMRKPPKGAKGIIWASDVGYASVDVIAYPSGTLTGQVAGFSYPNGLCSDKSGNVYVADFSNERGYEIQAGSTTVINSWPTGGEAIGCSVSDRGDVAFTNFYPGGVKIVAGPDAGASYSGPGYDWPAGYDKHGNLFVECSYAAPCSSPHLAELVNGSWQLLNFDTTIAFPGAVQLMGTVLGVADQAPGGEPEMGIYYTEVNGSNAHVVKTVLFAGPGSCSANFASSWASLSKKPNGVQSAKGAIKDIAAENNSCYPNGIDVWNAKKGGAPIASFEPMSGDASYAGTTFTK